MEPHTHQHGAASALQSLGAGGEGEGGGRGGEGGGEGRERGRRERGRERGRRERGRKEGEREEGEREGGGREGGGRGERGEDDLVGFCDHVTIAMTTHQYLMMVVLLVLQVAEQSGGHMIPRPRCVHGERHQGLAHQSSLHPCAYTDTAERVSPQIA